MKELYYKLARLMASIGVDKYMHSDIGEWISIFVLLSTIWWVRWWAPLLGWVAGSIVGALKELVFDRKTGGYVSLGDFLATSYGSAKPMIIAYSLLLLTSCGSHRVIENSQRDSIRIETKYRDTTIFDTVEVEIPKIVEVAKVCQDSSYLENKFAKSEAIILPSGELYHSLETIPQKIYAPIISKHTMIDSMIFRSRIASRTIEVERELTEWERFRLSGFWWLAVIVILMVYCKIQ